MTFKKITPKIIILSAYIAVVFIFRILDMPCIFRYFLGIPCPGCGMTRAILSAARLDIASAFRYHSMFWSVPVIILYLLSDDGLFKSRYADKALLILIGLGFTANWIFQIF